MTAPEPRKDALAAKDRDESRTAWTAPALTRMAAGDAENGFPGTPDGGFTQS